MAEIGRAGADTGRAPIELRSLHERSDVPDYAPDVASLVRATRQRNTISSQPNGFTVTRSPVSTSTVVVSASMIAGPVSV